MLNFYYRSCVGLYVVTQWLQLKTWLIDYPREGVKCLISIPGGRKSTYPCYLFDKNTIDIFLNFWIVPKHWLGDSSVFVALTCLALTIASLGIALLWPFCGIHCYTRQNTANGKKRHITPRDLKKSDFQIFRKRFFWRNFVSKFELICDIKNCDWLRGFDFNMETSETWAIPPTHPL